MDIFNKTNLSIGLLIAGLVSLTQAISAPESQNPGMTATSTQGIDGVPIAATDTDMSHSIINNWLVTDYNYGRGYGGGGRGYGGGKGRGRGRGYGYTSD